MMERGINAHKSSWSPPTNPLLLRDDEVHVWRAPLDHQALLIQKLQQTLSGDERTRAERFYFQKDRERFTVARGLLRTILAGYLGNDPRQLRFCYSPNGKPALVSQSGLDSLRFNVSHSHELALIAIARGREVGIDLECCFPQIADEYVADRFFSRQEVALLRALPPSVRSRAFFIYWTLKEAYVKGSGEGLSIRLDHFDVSSALVGPVALQSANGVPKQTSRWSLHTLIPGPGYVAALAAEGHDWQLRCWQWVE